MMRRCIGQTPPAWQVLLGRPSAASGNGRCGSADRPRPGSCAKGGQASPRIRPERSLDLGLVRRPAATRYLLLGPAIEGPAQALVGRRALRSVVAGRSVPVSRGGSVTRSTGARRFGTHAPNVPASRSLSEVLADSTKEPLHPMGLLSHRPRLSGPGREPILPAPPPTEPTILLTHEGWLVGHLVDATGRVSDSLARNQSIGLMTDVGLHEVDRDEVLMVIPPGWATPSALRIAKRRVPVTVDVAEAMSVTGFCHLAPGATVWDTWQRSTSGFAPLTDAVIGFPDGTTETADVVLISRHVAGSGLRF